MEAFRDERHEDMPHVRHARPYFELDLTPGGAHAIGHPHGVVAQHLIAADLNDRRGQPGGIAVKRRDIGSARIGAGEIVIDEQWRIIGAEHRIVDGVHPERGPGKCEIGPGRQSGGSGR